MKLVKHRIKSLCDNKKWRNVLRLYSRELDQDVKSILDYNRVMQQEAFDRILLLKSVFQNYPIYFRNISQNVNDWVAMKKAVRKQFPKKTILNIGDHTRLVTRTNEKSEEELISNFMKAGMRLKLEEDMINIFLSQMNRSIETSGLRSDMGKALPVSSDIFGADSVFQCADIVVALHRPGFYGLTEWEGIPTGVNRNDPNSQDHLMIECILKQRDGWTGNLLMRHNLAHNQIIDYD